MNISQSAFALENLVSRDGFGSPVPRQPAHLHTQAESNAYLRDPSRVPRRRPILLGMAEARSVDDVKKTHIRTHTKRTTAMVHKTRKKRHIPRKNKKVRCC